MNLDYYHLLNYYSFIAKSNVIKIFYISFKYFYIYLFIYGGTYNDIHLEDRVQLLGISSLFLQC